MQRSLRALSSLYFKPSSKFAATGRYFNSSAACNAKETIEGLASKINFDGQRVFVRADLNVPLSKNDSNTITDDTRIRAVLPTVQKLCSLGSKVVLCSHFGRPKGEVVDSMRLTPVAERLSILLDQPVIKMDDCIGSLVENKLSSMQPGSVVLLENVRFHKGETKNCSEFSRQLARLADIYVNDAFGTAHRAHASTAGVTEFLDHKVAGYLMEKELKYLKGAVESPLPENLPMAAIIGGAKVSTKITVIESLMDKCQTIILGGGMIFTFFKAQGLPVGASLVEEDFVELAKTILDNAKSQGVNLMLPSDVIIADKFAADANSKEVSCDAIPDGWMGLDIGPNALSAFKEELSKCNTVVWNGPMGVFEFDKFANGTLEVAQTLAQRTKDGATTIIGGGDSVAAVEKMNLSDQMSHISTGGGACLELLEGKILPGVAALDDA